MLTPSLRAGDPAALDAVVRELRPRLYGFLLRVVRRPEVAEELLQEALLRLVRHLPGLPDGSRVDLWCFTVAHNLARSWWRWSLLDGERLLRAAAAWRGAPQPDPLDALLADRRAAEAERAIAALPVAEREIVLLVGVERLGYDEAAEVLGLRPDAVRQRWSRALARLRGGEDGAG